MQRPTRIHGQLLRKRKPVQSVLGLQLRRLLLLCSLSSQLTLYTPHCRLFWHSICLSILFRIFCGPGTCYGVSSPPREASIFDHRLEQLTTAHLFWRGGLLTAVFPILYSVVSCESSSLFAEVFDRGWVMEGGCRNADAAEGFCFARACTTHKLSTAIGSVAAVESMLG
jgi:hypothetical protein